jgi:glycosyltransferase involved in cell wall biosynthesis
MQISNNFQGSSSKHLTPSVSILLCIFEGKHFLLEQLESIAAQTHKNWKIYVSDDGNCKDSLAILEEFKSRYQDERVIVISGPKQGFAKNFISLACNLSINSEYYAFCDQDDIWNTDKLERSISFLSEIENSIPALYCSRTTIVDKNNIKIGLSPLFSKPPSFANALVQNIGGGNTMLFNNRARDLLVKAGPDLAIVTHDWWMYLLICGVDGKVIYDANPSLRYRQHESNLVGCNITWTAKLYRIYKLLLGRFRDYNDRNERTLRVAYNLLPPRNQQILDGFSSMRKSNLIGRIRQFSTLQIYRQTFFGNLGIWVAVILNKL